MVPLVVKEMNINLELPYQHADKNTSASVLIMFWFVYVSPIINQA